jgi:hypothetical protein
MKTISDHILDILQNSTRAGATEVHLNIDTDSDRRFIAIEINDNGKGIEKAILQRVTDPFTTTRTTRRVGLGLPLLKQHCEMTGGLFSIKSDSGSGTNVRVTFGIGSIDRQPLGDLAGTVTLFITGNPQVNLIFSYRSAAGNFTFTTAEIKEALEDDELNLPQYFRPIRDLISSNLDDSGVGEL